MDGTQGSERAAAEVAGSHPPVAAKALMALLGPADRADADVYARLESMFGPIDYKGAAHVFDATDYYRDEFGENLRRHFISFRGLVDPARLPELKAAAAAFERELAYGGRRRWNLDAGYMDADKLVLGSYKRGACKLYMGQGIWADMLMRYSRGSFEPLPWAFADFRDGRYARCLLAIREKLKAEMRSEAAR